ncbi:MAG: DKNYY domain-containing protein [Planctomycetota bacterium]|jgi:hypothetical protein
MKKTAYRITDENRLEIGPPVASQFEVILDEFGAAIASSPGTLIVFDDESGVKEFDLSSSRFRHICDKFFVLEGQLYHLLEQLGPIDEEGVIGKNKFYVWDAATVYYLNGPVQAADPSSFCHLDEFWAKDSGSCFFQSEKIFDAEPSSFRAISNTLAVDAKHVYGFLGQILAPYTRDPTPLGRGYWDVGGKVVFGTKVLPDADLATFATLPQLSPEQKREIWSSGGPKDEAQDLAISDFLAYDCNRLYRGIWSKERK